MTCNASSATGDYAVIPPGVSPVVRARAADEALARIEPLRPAACDPADWGRVIVGAVPPARRRQSVVQESRRAHRHLRARCVERMPAAPPLVIVGKPLHARAGDADRGAFAAADVSSRCRAIGDDELAAVYSRAALLLFPSLAEGFGWPVLEAMACGCRVVTSNRAPMTEVGGDAADLCRSGGAEERRGRGRGGPWRARRRARRRVHEGLSRAAPIQQPRDGARLSVGLSRRRRPPAGTPPERSTRHAHPPRHSVAQSRRRRTRSKRSRASGSSTGVRAAMSRS